MLCALITLGSLVFFAAIMAFVASDPQLPRNSQQPGKLEYFTFGVGLVGVVVVFAYTTAAFLQWRVTNDILEGDMRPYVAALSPTDFVSPPNAGPCATATPAQPALPFQIGQRLRMGVHLYNYGKLPAKATVNSILTYSVTRRQKAESFKADRQENWLIWPNPTTLAEAARLKQDTYALSLNAVHEPDLENAKHGLGYVYLAAKITYQGYDQRRTHCVSICQEWEMKPQRSNRSTLAGFLSSPVRQLCGPCILRGM